MTTPSDPAPMKWIEDPVLEERLHDRGHLVTIALPHGAGLADRIVGLADAGQQHQVHIAEAICAQDHEARRLLELLPRLHTRIGDASCPAVRGEVDTRDPGIRFQGKSSCCEEAAGITVICGLALALASHPKFSQKPQYWHSQPSWIPSGLV